MKTKAIIHKALKGGGHVEIAAGYHKPFFRNKQKKERREINVDILPTVCYSSDDHYWGYGSENQCQTTLYIGWIIFFVYFETFRPVRGTAENGKAR